MYKILKLIGLSAVMAMLVSCTSWVPFVELKPLYVDPRSGTWSTQQPTASEIQVASQNSSSYLSVWGPKYYPGLDYTEPIAFGVLPIYSDQPNSDKNLVRIASGAGESFDLYTSQYQLYKNPNLTNPRPLTCTLGLPATAAPAMLICR
jgi:hypothetical protein